MESEGAATLGIIGQNRRSLHTLSERGAWAELWIAANKFSQSILDRCCKRPVLPFVVGLVQDGIVGKLLDTGDAIPLQVASQLQRPAPHLHFLFKNDLWDGRRQEPF